MSEKEKEKNTPMPKNTFRLWYEKSKDPVQYWISILGLEDMIKEKKKEIGEKEKSSLLSTFYR